MEKEKLVRFNLMISPTQINKIDDYRKGVGTLPSRGEAVRDLVQLGLETYRKNKKEPNRKD